ncbi:MAG: LytTR family DNA-binding domain-containing protein [Bacteroidota bacterium]
MNVVIIEDEHLTADRIQTLLLGIDPEIRITAILDSVKSSVQWFQQHDKPDLVFMDIQLADGLSFEIFDQVKVDCPVIFLTAYQEYAIKAFKVNSVDYLLKPVSEEEMRSALTKFKQYFSFSHVPPVVDKVLLDGIRQMISSPYKARFMVKVGDRIRSVEAKDILYFYSLQKGTFMHTAENRNYVIDFTLDALTDLLDPIHFQRINRQYIVSHSAIRELITLSGSKLKINLLHCDDREIYISRERIQPFKLWLDR